MNMIKRRYSKPGYPTLRHRWFGFRNFHHVLNLFVAYHREREHPQRIVVTERYGVWLTQRDNWE